MYIIKIDKDRSSSR